MTSLRRLLAAAILLVLSAAPALAVQGSGCLPITGMLSGVAYSTLINSAVAALISTNSGVSAPSTDCSSAPVTGQQWYDTSTSVPAWRIWDGSTGLLIGRVDPTNHVWQPQIGGGLTTIASAATVDLCSVPQGYVTINGSATITAFGSSCAIGQIKALNFSSVLTLAYSTSAILLPTAASVATQAGDQAVAAYTGGGIWRIVSYTRADGTALTATVVPPIHYAGDVAVRRAATCSSGSVLEDGSAISRTTYATLFAVLGTTWGAGDGSTTFNIPDSRGRFNRGWGPGQTLDSGRVFGSTQLDQLQDHTHTYSFTGITSGVSGTSYGAAYNGGTLATSAPITGNHGSETRPNNVTSYNCIFTSNSP